MENKSTAKQVETIREEFLKHRNCKDCGHYGCELISCLDILLKIYNQQLEPKENNDAKTI